jgi:hypothetical protein
MPQGEDIEKKFKGGIRWSIERICGGSGRNAGVRILDRD